VRRGRKSVSIKILRDHSYNQNRGGEKKKARGKFVQINPVFFMLDRSQGKTFGFLVCGGERGDTPKKGEERSFFLPHTTEERRKKK